MYTVKIRLPGAIVSLMLVLMLVAVMVLAFATVAAAQTPADDQYGSPTGQAATDDGVAGGSGGGVASDPSDGGPTSKAGEASGGVLPSTGGAPIFLLLAGALLVGTGVTLQLRHRADS